MSKRQYLKALNAEISKLNEVIDRKIIQNFNYKSEAKRHKKLLAQIRKNEVQRSFVQLLRAFFPLWH